MTPQPDRGPIWQTLYDNLPDEIATVRRGEEVADTLARAVAPFVPPELTQPERHLLWHLAQMIRDRTEPKPDDCPTCAGAVELLDRLSEPPSGP